MSGVDVFSLAGLALLAALFVGDWIAGRSRCRRWKKRYGEDFPC